jgi:hypothetical protein
MEYFMDEIDNLLGENREYIIYSDFTTLKGLSGVLMVLTTYQQERLIQFNFVCFSGNNGKIMIITGTNLANNSVKFSELFVNTARTFEWLR